MPTLYLIDGHAQFFRAYHAIRSRMSSPVTQEPTNLTFGFVGMLIKLMRDYKPDYVAVAIDVGGDKESFRSQIYPEYKANREEAPDDFHPQVERCLKILEQMHVPVIGQEGVEADDVIATMVRRLRHERPDLDIRIVSKDKDLAQLLGEHVQLFDVHTDETVTAADIFKTEGVRPEHVVDILALMGDSIDNIPGAPGIGPKTAAQLVLEYGSIEKVYEHLEEIKGKKRESLESVRAQVPVNRLLVALKDDVPIEFDLERARIDVQALPVDSLLATFRELGFNRHGQDLRALALGNGGPAPAGIVPAASSAPVPARARVPEEPSLFSALEAPSSPPPVEAKRGDYQAVTSAAQLRDLVERLRTARTFAVDTETTSVFPMRAALCGISVATEPGRAWYLPVRSPRPEEHLDEKTVLDHMRPLLEDPSIGKVGHNLKYDMNVLRRHGVRLAGPCFDTMIASYVIDATRSSHRLDVLALALLQYTCIPLADLLGRGRAERTFDQVPLEQAVSYAAEDADIALRLRDVLSAELDAAGLRRLFDEVEMPLVPVLADLEFNGIRVDREELERQRLRLAERIDSLRREIGAQAPHPFNPDSPRQLAAALFNRPDAEPPGLGLPPQKRRKTGPSTDVEVLERLAQDPRVTSPLPGLIVEYRQLTKLVSTYLIALAEDIHPDTGRVHASFNQTVAATGRLSSSDPNLQNIPIRTPVGREIRRAFRAEPGSVLLTADYSQIELRLLAHLSQDAGLIEAFRQGADIHRAVAASVFGVDASDVTPTQRHSAKMINFGIVYGITPFGLARRLGGEVGQAEAARIIDGYKARFPRIETFLAECVAAAHTRGYVETMLGRRRRIPEVRARHPGQRALGERMAINSVVQGSAADLIKLAMIDLHRRLPEPFPGARLILQIHDELVFEAPRAQVEALEPFVRERMESAMALDVALVVNTAWSESWIDA